MHGHPDSSDTITECLTQAKSDDPGAQCAALNTLSSLTKVSSGNRAILAAAPDAIPCLFSLSASPSHSPSVRTLALSTLLNLSLNHNLKHLLASDPTAIHHLNTLILSPFSSHSARVASSLVCSLAMFDKNKAGFGVHGTVEALVEALREGAGGDDAVRHLLSALEELVQFHGNCTLAVRAGAPQYLIQILRGPREDLAGSSLILLGLLVRFDEGVNAVRGVDGLVDVLLDGLGRGCMSSRDGAAEVLARMFEEGGEGYMRVAAGKHEFPSLLADLAIRGSAKGREKAGLLMKMMMEANLDCYVEGSPIILR